MLMGCKHVTGYLEELNALSQQQLDDEMQQKPQEYVGLLNAVAVFLTRSCGQLNKVYEKVTQLELQQQQDESEESTVYEHVRDGYGADLVLCNAATGEVEEKLEIKTSMTKQCKGRVTNWVFRLSEKLELSDENGQALFDSLYNKGTRVLLQAKSSDSQPTALNSYELSGQFVALLVTRLALRNKKRTVNLGRSRCDKCEHYHYVQHLQKYDQLLQERGAALSCRSGAAQMPIVYETLVAQFTAEEWHALLEKTVTQKCQ
jgi:hypothetical protein